ncbi:extracellular solute-binding protein [Rugamonas sp.]|uniref:extracellular solute-binding protein n=1 Tax=Rugamonas sp. TaxID=1926287 RepID=UPI0025F6A56C|nr:extracellular solute-binding protein [Rugamonas sp.]
MRIAPYVAAGLLALGLALPARAATVALKFIVPSGATAESSRLYYNLAHEFERQQPDIRVDFMPLGQWDDVIAKLRQLPEGGRAAVFVAEVSETLELEQMGLIEPFGEALARYGNEKAFLAPFLPEFLGNSYCRGGKLCGPPFVRSTPVVLYNLEKLRDAGLGQDSLPAGWADFETVLGKLHARSHQAPFCLGGDWYDYLFEAMVRQSGGALMDMEHGRVTLATPEATEALAFWKRLKDEHYLVRMNTWKATLNGFVGGYCAVSYYSSGGLETVRAHARFAWMADMLPKNKNYGVAVGGGNLYLAKGMSAAEQQAALKLAAFLYQPSVQARISVATGFFPVVAGAFADTALAARYAREEPFLRVRAQLKYAKPKLMSTNNMRLRTVLKQAIDRVLDEGMDPAASLRWAQREADRLAPPLQSPPP